ncbi:type II secretion system protein N [Acinetobacter sp. YH12136]|uniref:type II secretion system protein N n=1 Tax=Acinetobacter sp. YH12136 TaxID=2601120 RepID=UPI0015D255F8|nr:type II secretion system protein N [Acinetobacter sp. YH12136]
MRDFSERWANLDWKQVDRVAPVLLTLLILYLCWKLASLFWLVLAPPQAMQVDRVELGSQQPQIPNISSFALFHEVGRTATVDDQLNMTLQGVVVGQPSQFSSAVIKVNDVAERYRVGDVIDSSQYQLAEVYWDRVILRHSSGATREILFKGIENGLNQPIAPLISSGNAPAMVSPTAPAQPNNAIGQAVQRIQEDREQYLKEMGVETNTGNGYEVTTRTPAALRNKLGLQPGDRILSLNGQSVGQGQNDAQLLEQARREGQVKLEIKRGDQVMTIQQNF